MNQATTNSTYAGAMKVVAIVVSYRPQLEVLCALLDALTPQVDAVVVVDNGSEENVGDCMERYRTQNVCSVLLGINAGVSAAQNVGIDWARQQEADYVVLFDQDSLPAPSMVGRLIEAARLKQAAGFKVAAVGPRYLDERQDNPPPFIRLQGLKLLRQPCKAADSIVDVDYLISSGCLIPIKTLDSVGVMREDLFIDYVDIEWGLRAKSKGFQSFGVCSAHMKHNLGDSPIIFFGKKIPLHSPLRHYYHFRNAVLLYAEPWPPLNWKLADGWRLCLKYIFYSLFTEDRLTQFRMMTLGLWHGLVRKSGKLERTG